MIARILLSTLLLAALPAAAEERSTAGEVKDGVKEGARTVGHATRDATRAVGHAARDTTKAIGHGTRDAAKGTKKAVKDAWHDTFGSKKGE